MKSCYTLLLTALYLLLSNPAQADDRLEITYIANAGVMVSYQGKTVLVDAHHYRGNPYYQRNRWQTLEKMVNAMRPFGRVDLILATHQHADHFDAETVGKHLLLNPDTRFLSSEQLTTLIQKNFKDYDKISNQIITITPRWKFFEETTVADIPVKILGMKHGSQRFSHLQNNGFIFKLGKYTFLHIGDADTAAENFEPFNLPNEGIDFAFVPYWFLMYDKFDPLVSQHLIAGKLIAIHVPPEEYQEVEQAVHQKYPDAILFAKPLDSVAF